MPPPSVALAFDLLTLKVVCELRVTWATSVPISVFLSLSICSQLRPDVRDRCRQTSDVRQHRRLMPRLWGGGIIMSHGKHTHRK